ncbi:MAG: DUF3108 domain-containing protein [Fluviicoccus sp.]|uniref:DUF3108 domain-containing protein n=1 Tax=Fluviicoccus sp. TaxID=2003552 RepID=UPI00272114F3|nr:DUF3108 domain-containing protein [Fluviicoccus sp.]MDO8330401.1 DUF3108 domain-containing protein [Fluviicoccus sp.]
MSFAWFKRHTLGTALLLSLLVHLSMMWDGDLAALTEMLEPDDPDQVLEKKKAKSVPKVKLNVKSGARPTGVAGATRVTLTFVEPPKPVAVPPVVKPLPTPKPAARKPVAASNSAPGTPVLTAENGPAVAPPPPPPPVIAEETPVVAQVDTPPAPPAPKVEPPPAFPAELQANFRAAVEGIKANVLQVWRMEGYQYSIENSSSFVGFKFRMTTEGEITPDGTLKPWKYRLMMNKKILRFADFDYQNNVLSYGKPDRPRSVRITENIYDHLSMAYQLAVSFTGEPMTLYFTTGASFSIVDLTLAGEETLKLPGGILKTLHIQGKSREGTPFEVDIWLAPEHRNFPAKILIKRKAETLEMSLKDLSFEGQMRYGKKVKGSQEEDEDSSVPAEWMDRPDFKQYQQEQKGSGLPGEDAP